MTLIRTFLVLAGLFAFGGCSTIPSAVRLGPAPVTSYALENARPQNREAAVWGPSVTERARMAARGGLVSPRLYQRLASSEPPPGWNRPPWASPDGDLMAIALVTPAQEEENATERSAPDEAEAVSNSGAASFDALGSAPIVTASADADMFVCEGDEALSVTFLDGRQRATAAFGDGAPLTLERAGLGGRGGLYASPNALMRVDPTGVTWIAGSETVEVRAGDSLWAIAERTLGSGARWEEIASANGDRIADPNTIRPGQVLRLPGQQRRCRRADAPLASAGPDDGA